MNKVLVLKSSMIEDELSYSHALLHKYLTFYKEKNPTDVVEIIDLNNLNMAQKPLNKNNMKTFWNAEDSDKHIDVLKSINKLIIVTPMTNFNYPAVLKNYIDHIAVANKTFSYKYSKNGDAIGLLTNIKVQILATQGAPFGWYPWGNHVKALEGTFNFLGCHIHESLLIDGTKSDPNKEFSPQDLMSKFEDKIKISAHSF